MLFDFCWNKILKYEALNLKKIALASIEILFSINCIIRHLIINYLYCTVKVVFFMDLDGLV